MTEKELMKKAIESFNQKPVGYENNLELIIYADGFKDGYRASYTEDKGVVKDAED